MKRESHDSDDSNIYRNELMSIEKTISTFEYELNGTHIPRSVDPRS